MINNQIIIILLAAGSVGFLHTILGPDHYLPFVVLSHAKKWTLFKTLSVAFLCGTGHILSSILLGIIGIVFSIGLEKLIFIEAIRDEIASWLLIGFGFVYCVYGLKHIFRQQKHSHSHTHSDEEIHSHLHDHTSAHLHMHLNQTNNLTPWILFIIFVFGPCETLIPLLIYPAAQHNIPTLLAVIAVFGATTILTMFLTISVAYKGIKLLPSEKIKKFSHSFAGATILLSGLAIKFLGW